MLKKYILKLIKNKKLTKIKNKLVADIIKLKKFQKIKKIKKIKTVERSWRLKKLNISKYNRRVVKTGQPGFNIYI